MLFGMYPFEASKDARKADIIIDRKTKRFGALEQFAKLPEPRSEKILRRGSGKILIAREEIQDLEFAVQCSARYQCANLNSEL